MADVPDSTFIEGLASWELEHIAGIQTAVDEGDAAMFRMARKVAEARESGMEQQRIATNIRKPNGESYSRQWVGHVEKALRYHDSNPDAPWSECWDYALGRGAHGKGENPDGDEWFTPKWIFDALGLHFSFDVASPPGGPPYVPCDNYFTENENGLDQEWSGTIWMNPPYSAITPWADKWISHGDGVALLPFVKSAWLHKVVGMAGVIWVPATGIDFESPDGTKKALSYMVFLAGIGADSSEAVSRVFDTVGGALR